MAYKFQLGAFTASGSIKAEEGVNANSAGVGAAGAIAGATSIDGSGDLTMGTITMTGFSVDADGDTALKSLAVDNSSTIGCDADADIMTLAAQSLALANDVDFNVAKAGGLQLAGVAVTSTAAELNLLDGVSGLVQDDFTKLAAIDATAAEINLIDGDTARQTANGFADGDGLIHNDDGTMRMTNVTKLVEYVLPKITGGDVVVDSAGDAKIQAGAVESGMLNANVISGQTDIGAAIALTDELLISDNGVLRRTDVSRISPAIAGTGVEDNGGQLEISPQQTLITQITNASLGKIGTATNQEYIDFGTANEIKFAVDDSLVATVEAGKFVVAGDLQVNGTTTTVDTTNLLVKDRLITLNDGGGVNSGAGAGFEIEEDGSAAGFIKTNPSARAEWHLKAPGASVLTIDMDANGELEYTAAKKLSIAGNFTIDADIGSSAAEINLLDHDTAIGSSITIADADGILVHNADGGMEKVPASDLKAYLADNSMNVTGPVSDGATLANGVNFFASSSANISVNLPASPSVGDSVMIKAMENCGSTRLLTINRQGSHTIDGATEIILESPHAAVECVFVAANTWKVF